MSSSTHTGVEGFRVTPAFMPAACICCMVQMGACLVVNVHHHGTQLGCLLNILFRVLNHEVNVQRFGACFRYGF